MSDPAEVHERARVRVRGDIELGIPTLHAHFSGLEISRDDEDESYHLRLEGRLGELRKLKALGPDYAEMLGHLSQGPDDGTGSVTLRAKPDLARELRAAEPNDARPDAWLDREGWTRLAFSFDRYEPESVSRLTAEWSL